jgi:hypothetical protein
LKEHSHQFKFEFHKEKEMADFRKLFLALIAGALLFTAVASAQPYACAANAVPTLGRSEGIAEMTGDVLLVCSGSIPGGGILANIRYRLTQNITSDLESGSSITEALLILDEGADGFRGDGAAVGQQNVYQAMRISADEIEWTGVWLAAPGSAAFQTIRLTNIRGNAQAAGDFGTLFATVNIVSPTSVPVNNPVLRVMDTRPGLTFSVDDEGYKNCEDPTDDIVLNFTEGFAAAFRPQGDAATDNIIPGGGYLNESGFSPIDNLVAGDIDGTPGQATQGTRLMARFKNIPSGVDLSVPSQIGDDDLVACLVEDPDADGGGGSVGFSVSEEGIDCDSVDGDVPSSGLVVYEVVYITPESYSTQETLSVDVDVDFDIPGPLGSGTVNGNFAPISTVYVMSGSGAEEPRFVDKATDSTALTISPCRTILLFPYVTNQAGFDTGLAISNTTADPLGTTAQAGACTINYYGNTNGSTAPAAQTSPSVGSGAHLAFMLSGGGGVFARNNGFTACASGACVAPLFQGYIIAICDFQFAHGFAFISDVQNDPSGRTLGSQGYLALIIPDRGTSSGSREPQDSSLGAETNHGEGLAQ